MSIIQILKALLQVSGNVADGLTLLEWFKYRREVNLLSIYCDAFKQSFEDQLPHTSELSQAESAVFNRDAFEHELQRRALQIETLPAVASELDAKLLQSLTEMLCRGVIISGTDVSQQTAHRIISAAHRKYQRIALTSSPDVILQTQITGLARKLEERERELGSQFDELLNALTKLEILVSNSQSASLPVPRVFLPELEPWIQVLSLRRLGDPLVSSQTYTLYDLLAGDSQKIVLMGKSGSGKTCTMQAIAYALLTQDAQAGYCAWIPLRSYAHSLKSTIKNSIGWDELPEEKVLRALEEHEAVLLLDGLNEVVPEEQRRQCAAEIEQLVRSYRGRLFVSFPTTDYNFDFNCPAYEILPLSESQVRQIVKAFFAEAGRADEVEWFFDRVTRRSEQVSRDFFSLAQTPLNLRFLLELASTDDFGRDSLRNLYGRVIEKR